MKITEFDKATKLVERRKTLITARRSMEQCKPVPGVVSDGLGPLLDRLGAHPDHADTAMTSAVRRAIDEELAGRIAGIDRELVLDYGVEISDAERNWPSHERGCAAADGGIACNCIEILQARIGIIECENHHGLKGGPRRCRDGAGA